MTDSSIAAPAETRSEPGHAASTTTAHAPAAPATAAIRGEWPRLAPLALEPDRRRGLAYAVAILAPALALALDLAYKPIEQRGLFLALIAAVVLTAWLGGWRPSIVAVVASTVGATIAVSQPPVELVPTAAENVIRVAVFAVAAAVAAWLVGGLQETRDVSRREADRADAARRQLMTVLESVANPIVVVNAERRLLYANAAVAAFFGTDSTGLERTVAGVLADGVRSADGRPLGPNEHPVALAMRGRAATLRLGRIEIAPGEERYATVQATPIPGEGPGVPGAVVVSWRDATEEHENDVAREAFMGVLAHELRTPITTVFGGAELLASRGDRLPADTRREIARDVLHEATRLSRIAENLLVLSRAERGQLRIAAEPVLLEPLVRAVVESEAQRWPATSFRVESDGRTRLPVLAEPAYIEQVLRNLLSNAAKYAAIGSEVVLSVERLSDHVAVRVEDEGPGFPEEDADRLFELYYRSATTAKAAPGSGIGLYVCRRLVEAMSGRIWAENRPTGGARFVFSLPTVEQAADAPVDDLAEAAGRG